MAAVLARLFSRAPAGTTTPADGPPVTAQNRRAQDRVVGEIAREASDIGREAASLNGAVDDVARIAEGQRSALDVLVASMERMAEDNRAIGNMAVETQGAAAAARGAVERVGLGVRGASQSLHEVFEAASEIGQIALQTRLVAFNASVEAKRAGEAGRGFAVVADAVKDLSQKVEVSSKQIVSTIQALGAKIEQLSRDLIDAGDSAAADTFQAAFRNVEKKIAAIAESAARNLATGETVIADTSRLKDEIDTTHRAIGQARQSANGFLALSERLLELTADTGAETVDTPYIQAATAGAAEIGALLERALDLGQIKEADLFDCEYRAIAGSNPQQHTTRYLQLTDRVFPEVQERIATLDKVVFCAAVDRNGYLPTHNLKFSKPQGKDAVWNNANSRNRRIFDDRTGLAAGRNTRKFLLQTYRRDMGGGKFVVMKDLSAPIMVRGRHWGGLRIGYQF